MTVFRLYQNAPFTFENNLLFTNRTGTSETLSSIVEDELNRKQLQFGGGFVTLDGRDITGNETEIYLTFDYRNYKEWAEVPANETYAGDIVKRTLKLLQSCNIIRALYQINSGRIKSYETGGTYTKTAKNYFFNIQSVEIVNAAPEDIKENPARAHPVVVWLQATTYRLIVKRNKLLEAYFEGFFDTPDNIQIRGGTISGLSCRAWQELLNGKSERKTRAAQNVTPAEKLVHSTGRPWLSNIFERQGYYVFVSGTYSYTTSGNTGKPYSVGSDLLAVVNKNTKKPLVFGVDDGVDLFEEQYEKLMQLSNAQKFKVYDNAPTVNSGGGGGAVVLSQTDGAKINTQAVERIGGNYTPKNIYLIPCEFFGGFSLFVDGADTLFGIYSDLDESLIESKSVFALPFTQFPQSYRGKRYKIPKATPNTFVEVGTMTTRVTIPDTLAVSFSEKPPEAYVYPQVTYSRYDSSIKAELIFSGGRIDITQDLIFPLSAQNITSSEAAAIAQQRQTGFVQQAGAVIAGVAAIGAAVVSGGAFLPAAAAIVGGAGAVVGGLSGMQQTAEAIKNEKGITATQNGGTMAIMTAYSIRGCGVWTYADLPADDTKQYLHILYNAAINAAELIEPEADGGKYSGIKFLAPSNQASERDEKGDSIIIMQNAFVSGLPKDIAEEVETRLNSGAIICYGLDYIRMLATGG